MDNLVIIDGNSLINRAFYALPPLSASNGQIYNAVYGFSTILIRLITEHKPEYLAVAFDYGHKTFRNEIYPEYKGTRKGMPAELAQQLPVLKDLLQKMNIQIIERQGIEADDIIGTLCKKFGNKVHSIIVTGDRDCLQLIDSNTEVWLTKHGISEIVSENERQLKEDFGLTPSQVIDLKSLMGDASDNIPGVAGIGEKTAKNLLSTYGSMREVYNNIDKIGGKLAQKLIDGKEDAEMSYKLATIVTDCDIQCTLDNLRYDFPFSAEVREAFVKYEFRSLIKRSELFEYSPSLSKYNAKSVQVIEISPEQIADIISRHTDAKMLALYIAPSGIHFAFDQETNYQVQCSGETLNECLKQFKNIFANTKIQKIFYSKKAMLHTLGQLNLPLQNSYDVSLGVYLINSNVREDEPSYMFEFLSLPSQTIATSLLSAWEFLLEELPKKKLDKLYWDMELPLVDVLYDMEITGFKIDQKVIDELSPRYHRELDIITQRIYDYAGQTFNISSPKQLGKVLFEDLKLPDKGNKKHSTAVDKLTELYNSHPIIPALLRYRQITKLLSTYIDGMRNYISSDGKIHTLFNQTLTVTGRLSSNEPNLQNIPIRTDEGREIRKMFVPSSPDNVLLCADYSQIELRLLAHYSEDYNLCSAYRHGYDIHRLTASQIFGVSPDKVSDSQRRAAKAVNFGIIYGISPYGLANNIGNITAEQARQYIEKYFETYPTIRQFLDSSVEEAKRTGHVSTLFGRIRNIDLATESKRENAFGARAAMNMPLQGTASDIIKLAMLQIFHALKEQGLKTKMILQIHDELIFDVPKNELPTVYELVKNRMENVVELHVPLIVAINSGNNWYECDM